METRQAPRADISLNVVAEIDEDSRQRFAIAAGNRFAVSIVDISTVGLGIISKYFLPKGLFLEFEIGGVPFGLSENMKIKGEIRYSRYVRSSTYRCGVKFLNISDKYRNAIAGFVSTYERRKSPRIELSQ